MGSRKTAMGVSGQQESVVMPHIIPSFNRSRYAGMSRSLHQFPGVGTGASIPTPVSWRSDRCFDALSINLRTQLQPLLFFGGEFSIYSS